MRVEYYREDVPFMAEALGWMPVQAVLKKLENGHPHEQFSDFMWCDLTRQELEDFSGWLCSEANHTKKKAIAERLGELADYFTNKIYAANAEE